MLTPKKYLHGVVNIDKQSEKKRIIGAQMKKKGVK